MNTLEFMENVPVYAGLLACLVAFVTLVKYAIWGARGSGITDENGNLVGPEEFRGNRRRGHFMYVSMLLVSLAVVFLGFGLAGS